MVPDRYPVLTKYSNNYCMFLVFCIYDKIGLVGCVCDCECDYSRQDIYVLCLGVDLYSSTNLDSYLSLTQWSNT